LFVLRSYRIYFNIWRSFYATIPRTSRLNVSGTIMRISQTTTVGREESLPVRPHGKARRISAFWLFQCAGWSLLCAFYLFMLKATGIVDPKIINGVIIANAVGFSVSSVLRFIYRRFRPDAVQRWMMLLRVGGWCVAGGLAWYLVDTLVSLIVFGADKTLSPTIATIGMNVAVSAVTLGIWSFVYFAVKHWNDWKRERARAEEANRLARETELQMLRYQLNPHFLFNALNSVRSLMDEDKETAKTAITDLADFLRYPLSRNDGALVPLREELTAVGHYIALQKIRHEDRLDVVCESQPSAEDFPILSFLLQPLVENAIKFGMRTSPMPLHVRICAEVRKNVLHVLVANTGRWVADSEPDAQRGPGTQTGLQNVRQRLANAFTNAHRISVSESDGWVNVHLEINGGPAQ
jgi:two-component system, LytTR family, sensor kinase